MLDTNQWCLRVLICVTYLSTVGARVHLSGNVMNLIPLSFDSVMIRNICLFDLKLLDKLRFSNVL